MYEFCINTENITIYGNVYSSISDAIIELNKEVLKLEQKGITISEIKITPTREILLTFLYGFNINGQSLEDLQDHVSRFKMPHLTVDIVSLHDNVFSLYIQVGGNSHKYAYETRDYV